MKFPQSFIDEVRAAADIVTVVSDSVSLRKAGNAYKGLCPFHDERSPSFHVTPSRGMWYCFGCGEGGDAVKFVMRLDGLSFQDAVRSLAASVGVDPLEGAPIAATTAMPAMAAFWTSSIPARPLKKRMRVSHGNARA